jgi:segregation and condensation protein A
MTAIPDYRVELDAYSGPLDLLLYLVRRDEIDLYDIPIARLTEQYLAYLKGMQEIDVDLAGEFLVMAASLLEIKSAMLVPKAPQAPDQAGAEAATAGGMDQLDPRFELVQQLLAYKRFKDASVELEERRRQWESRYAAQPARAKPEGAASGVDAAAAAAAGLEDEQDAAPLELDIEDASIADLCDVFSRIMDTIGAGPARHEVIYDDTPIGLHAEDILDRLGREGPMTLQAIFEGRSRSEAIGLFLAMLELVRQRRIKAVQDQVSASGEVSLEIRPPEQADAGQAPAGEAGAATARWVNPQTGQVEYDWPSEEVRLQAERRAKFRASRLAKGPFPKAGAADMPEADDEVIDVDGPADAATQPQSPEPGDPADAGAGDDPAPPADPGTDGGA